MTGAEVTPTLIQEHNIPSTIKYGTSEKRLTKFYIEATSANAADTLDLATYAPGLTGIIAIEGNSLDGADASNDVALNTFATTIITFAGHAGSYVWKISVLAYY